MNLEEITSNNNVGQKFQGTSKSSTSFILKHILCTWHISCNFLKTFNVLGHPSGVSAITFAATNYIPDIRTLFHDFYKAP